MLMLKEHSIYDQIQAVNEPYRPDRVCYLKLVNGRKIKRGAYIFKGCQSTVNLSFVLHHIHSKT